MKTLQIKVTSMCIEKGKQTSFRRTFQETRTLAHRNLPTLGYAVFTNLLIHFHLSPITCKQCSVPSMNYAALSSEIQYS